jgi:hypothetical protein
VRKKKTKKKLPFSILLTISTYKQKGDKTCESESGGGCISFDQVDWYYETAMSLEKVPSLAFFHIPLQEYKDVWNEETCYGSNNDTVACQPIDTGLFAAFHVVGDVQGEKKNEKLD